MGCGWSGNKRVLYSARVPHHHHYIPPAPVFVFCIFCLFDCFWFVFVFGKGQEKAREEIKGIQWGCSFKNREEQELNVKAVCAKNTAETVRDHVCEAPKSRAINR